MRYGTGCPDVENLPHAQSETRPTSLFGPDIAGLRTSHIFQSMGRDTILRKQWAERRSESTPKRPNDPRSPFERDGSRLMHASAFRRLQGKTQVLGLGEGDFHRTRLTHSLEVAQVARGLVTHLQEGSHGCECLPSLPLIEAIALGHDIGHPPYGHSGEIALNYVMRDYGGFEGNAHSLRLLGRLEPYKNDYGLDLTRRTLLGVLKYPAPYSDTRRSEWPDTPTSPNEMKRDDWTPPKCYFDADQEIVDWLLDPLSAEDRETFQSLKKKPSPTENGKTRYKSLDATIMDAADDIAYGVHDLEDAIKLRLVHQSELLAALEDHFDASWGKSVGISDLETLVGQLFSTSTRKQAVGKLVHAFVLSTDLERRGTFASPLLDWEARLQEPARDFLDALDEHKTKSVIKQATTQQMEYRGRLLIVRLFNALASDPENLLKSWYAKRYKEADSEADAHRAICDYVAGMTDEYATEVYERLYVPRNGRVSAAR